MHDGVRRVVGRRGLAVAGVAATAPAPAPPGTGPLALASFLVLVSFGAAFRGRIGVCFGGCGLVPAIGGCVSGLLGRVLAAAALAAAAAAPAPAGGTARRGVLILLASTGGPILP